MGGSEHLDETTSLHHDSMEDPRNTSAVPILSSAHQKKDKSNLSIASDWLLFTRNCVFLGCVNVIRRNVACRLCNLALLFLSPATHMLTVCVIRQLERMGVAEAARGGWGSERGK